MALRTLTVRGVPDAALERLRTRAASNRRSLNGELLSILDDAASDDVPQPAGPMVREPSDPPCLADPELPAPLVSTLDHDALAAACRRHHITWLALFGSQARGMARPDSDVDVIVDFAPGKTPGFGIVRVAEALGNVFGGRRVDLVTRRGLSPRVREHVLASARPLYAAG